MKATLRLFKAGLLKRTFVTMKKKYMVNFAGQQVEMETDYEQAFFNIGGETYKDNKLNSLINKLETKNLNIEELLEKEKPRLYNQISNTYIERLYDLYLDCK